MSAESGCKSCHMYKIHNDRMTERIRVLESQIVDYHKALVNLTIKSMLCLEVSKNLSKKEHRNEKVIYISRD